MARITATLHAAHYFHKDLYLCHFFLDLDRLERDGRPSRIVLIDLHRLGVHRICARLVAVEGSRAIVVLDIGRRRESMIATVSVLAVTTRGSCPIAFARLAERLVRYRAARYGRHNRKRRQGRASGQ